VDVAVVDSEAAESEVVLAASSEVVIEGVEDEADEGVGDAGGSTPSSSAFWMIACTGLVPSLGGSSSLIFILLCGYRTAVKPSGSSFPLLWAGKVDVICAKTPMSCTEFMSVMISASAFSSLSRNAPR